MLAICLLAALADLPDIDALPDRADFPDVLTRLDGTKVSTEADWNARRKPELKTLFQHYMYGYFPDAAPVKATVAGSGTAFAGKAAWREVTLRFGPEGTPPISLLIVVPAKAAGPLPVFLGPNFAGNHTVLDEKGIALPAAWLRNGPHVKDGKALESGRGTQLKTWNAEMIVDRGYALATFYYGDVDPDRPVFEEGIHKHFLKPNQKEPGPHDWATICAWAYGVHRCVDHLTADPQFDKSRIAVVGHSRLGKTALLAAAFDERIALCIPHQAGCGGTAPSRSKVGESVTRINTSFPHWFNGAFKKFNDRTHKLPFDQHCLAALVAPRPLLYSNAVEDTWANPDGQFEMLKLADAVYKLLDGKSALEVDKQPEMSKLSPGKLAYFVRPGKHSMIEPDWAVFLDFADKHLKR